MPCDGIDVFIRWLLHHAPTSERARAFVTLTAFVSSDERLTRLRKADWLDEPLAEEFLSFAEPNEVADLLSFQIGHQLSADVFKKVFERALSATSDPSVVSNLISEGALYLRNHLGSFALPYERTQDLLKSSDLGDRIAGIRAIRYTGASATEIVTVLATALRSADWSEKWTALSQLREILDENTPTILLSAAQPELDGLIATLTWVVENDVEHDSRRSAAHSRSSLLKREKRDAADSAPSEKQP